VDFFLCKACNFLWHVPKGEDGPASQEVLLTAFRRSNGRTCHVASDH
jgi:hypothetical protein